MRRRRDVSYTKGNAARCAARAQQAAPLRKRCAYEPPHSKKAEAATKVRGFCGEKPNPSRKALTSQNSLSAGRMGHPQGQSRKAESAFRGNVWDANRKAAARRTARAQQAAPLRKRCAYEPPHSKKAEGCNEGSRFLRGKTTLRGKRSVGHPQKAKSLTSADANAAPAGCELQETIARRPNWEGQSFAFG